MYLGSLLILLVFELLVELVELHFVFIVVRVKIANNFTIKSNKNKLKDVMYRCVVHSLSWIRLFVTPWILACQASLPCLSPSPRACSNSCPLSQ